MNKFNPPAPEDYKPTVRGEVGFDYRKPAYRWDVIIVTLIVYTLLGVAIFI